MANPSKPFGLAKGLGKGCEGAGNRETSLIPASEPESHEIAGQARNEGTRVLIPHLTRNEGTRVLIPHLTRNEGTRVLIPHLMRNEGTRVLIPHLMRNLQNANNNN